MGIDTVGGTGRWAEFQRLARGAQARNPGLSRARGREHVPIAPDAGRSSAPARARDVSAPEGTGEATRGKILGTRFDAYA